MDKPSLNLKDLRPLWERELRYPVHESVCQGVLRKDMNVSGSASIQEIVGQPGALSQDCFQFFDPPPKPPEVNSPSAPKSFLRGMAWWSDES